MPSTIAVRSSPVASFPSSKYLKLIEGTSRGSGDRRVTTPARFLVAFLGGDVRLENVGNASDTLSSSPGPRIARFRLGRSLPWS
jgi:hypothetical protein